MSTPAYNFLRALVIDDNHHTRALIKSLLLAIGLKQVYEAADGGSGFEALRQHKPDFVLTDLSMKPVDGIEFTRMVRMANDSPNRYLPIIMITGHTERDLVMAARDAGVTEFIAKPITAQNLMSRIGEIVERPRPFIRSAGYFGPDRRRRKDPNYKGPGRRQDDGPGGPPRP